MKKDHSDCWQSNETPMKSHRVAGSRIGDAEISSINYQSMLTAAAELNEVSRIVNERRAANRYRVACMFKFVETTKDVSIVVQLNKNSALVEEFIAEVLTTFCEKHGQQTVDQVARSLYEALLESHLKLVNNSEEFKDIEQSAPTLDKEYLKEIDMRLISKLNKLNANNVLSGKEAIILLNK